MKEVLESSIYFGVLLSLASYGLGVLLRKKTGWGFVNPLLVSIILVTSFLLCSGMSYDSYKRGADLISYLLTPATICLAVPLYEQFETLKKNLMAVLVGTLTGVLSSLFCILLLSLAFGFDHTTFVTFLPKSITTAIGAGVCEELGGVLSLGVVAIVITGVLGNVFSETFLKLIRIEEPIAKGLAIGSSTHAVGTAKAFEIGPVEGAMSSLSIVVCGLMTVLLAPLFAFLL